MDNRVFRICLLVLFACVAAPTPARAESFVIAKATLDWSGFAYQVSDGLTIDGIVLGFLGTSSLAQTSGGSDDVDNGGADSFASSSYINTLGWATANAEGINGSLTSSSEAASQGGAPAINAASADISASTAFWLYGSGQGSLTVEVPYELVVEAVVDPALAPDMVSAIAAVSLQLGPGAGWFASESLSWEFDPLASSSALATGPLTKTGTLVLSRDVFLGVDQDELGPLMFIGAGAATHAVTSVPEPSSLALAGGGVLSILCARVARRREHAPSPQRHVTRGFKS